MSEPHTRYLHEQLTSAQGKYAYFLLAAAASAIALAVNQTAGEPLKRHQAFLGIAVLCWGLSFYFGCRYLGWMNATLRTNIILSMIQNGSFPGSLIEEYATASRAPKRSDNISSIPRGWDSCHLEVRIVSLEQPSQAFRRGR